MSIVLDKTFVPSLDESVEKDDENSQYDGYFCLNLDTQKCSGCGHYASYFEPIFFHYIVVWEEKDDEVLLKVAAKAKAVGDKTCKIVEYESTLGDCVEFYEGVDRGMFPWARPLP